MHPRRTPRLRAHRLGPLRSGGATWGHSRGAACVRTIWVGTVWLGTAWSCERETGRLDRLGCAAGRPAEAASRGIDVLEVALMHCRSERDIRELVRPQKQPAGFTRRIYLRYADVGKTRVKPIGCPHGRCHSSNFADHVVLLPEVARSGHGVLCRTCRRAPNVEERWQRVQFPREYLSNRTGRGFGGSLRIEAQTLTAPTPVPLDATPYVASSQR